MCNYRPTDSMEMLVSSLGKLSKRAKELEKLYPEEKPVIKQPALHAYTAKMLEMNAYAYGYFDEKVYLKEEVDRLLEKHGIAHD